MLAAGPVKGLAVTPDGDAVVSCSTDCSVRLFRLPFAPFAPGLVEDSAGAVLEFQGRHAFRGVDHHWTAGKFATAGAQVGTPLPAQALSELSWCGQVGGALLSWNAILAGDYCRHPRYACPCSFPPSSEDAKSPHYSHFIPTHLLIDPRGNQQEMSLKSYAQVWIYGAAKRTESRKKITLPCCIIRGKIPSDRVHA